MNQLRVRFVFGESDDLELFITGYTKEEMEHKIRTTNARFTVEGYGCTYTVHMARVLRWEVEER